MAQGSKVEYSAMWNKGNYVQKGMGVQATCTILEVGPRYLNKATVRGLNDHACLPAAYLLEAELAISLDGVFPCCCCPGNSHC